MGDPICFVYHDWYEDSWQFLPNRETQGSDIMIVGLGEVYQLDTSIGQVADLPNGWMASRVDQTSPWIRKRDHPFPVFEENQFYLDDAEAYEQLYPDQYHIPSSMLRGQLKKGDIVKLIFRFADEWAPRKNNECERMWVEVTEVDLDQEYYRGILLNDPKVHSAIASGHVLWFHPTHVFDIQLEENG